MNLLLHIENHYPHGTSTSDERVTVPAPHTQTQSLDDWAWEHLFEFTGDGTGQNCKAVYTVRVDESDDPQLLGKTFEFGD